MTVLVIDYHVPIFSHVHSLMNSSKAFNACCTLQDAIEFVALLMTAKYSDIVIGKLGILIILMYPTSHRMLVDNSHHCECEVRFNARAWFVQSDLGPFESIVGALYHRNYFSALVNHISCILHLSQHHVHNGPNTASHYRAINRDCTQSPRICLKTTKPTQPRSPQCYTIL